MTAEGRNALASFHEWRKRLVITDLRMAPMNGIELCRQIRAQSNVPIIVVSGEDDNVSKIEALDSGADDYVVKPYNAGELLALVRAVLRRGVDTADSAGSLDAGDVLIDFDARRVYVGASEVRLTPKQFDLLVYLARRPGRVVPHARLLAAVWGVEYSENRQYLRVFVRQLREKLEENPSRPRYLLTEPSIGYRFTPTPRGEVEKASPTPYESSTGIGNIGSALGDGRRSRSMEDCVRCRLIRCGSCLGAISSRNVEGWATAAQDGRRAGRVSRTYSSLRDARGDGAC